MGAGVGVGGTTMGGLNMFVEEFGVEEGKGEGEEEGGGRDEEESIKVRQLAAPLSFSSPYQCDPNDDESEDNIEHLVLIVHGIGEGRRSDGRQEERSDDRVPLQHNN